MITVWFYSIVSVTIVSLISLVGVLSLVVLVSFACGGLLGDTFIHCHIPTSEQHPHPLVFNLGAIFVLMFGVQISGFSDFLIP